MRYGTGLDHLILGIAIKLPSQILTLDSVDLALACASRLNSCGKSLTVSVSILAWCGDDTDDDDGDDTDIGDDGGSDNDDGGDTDECGKVDDDPIDIE